MSIGAPPGYAAPTWDGLVDAPVAFEAFDEMAGNQRVGSAGKVGVLDVDLLAARGATRISRRFQRGPLSLLYPLYVDPARPDMAFLYTVQFGEGLVQGDRYRLNLRCGPESAVHVTTQAATKLYRMDHNYAAQIVNVTADAGTFVEYLPDPIIPFRGSRFYQHTHVVADESAIVIVGEILLPGRVARGEQHAYTLFHSEVEVYRPQGGLLFADRTILAPPLACPESPGLLGAGGVLGTLYVITTCSAATLTDRLWAGLRDENAVLTGISELPNHAGVVVRLLGARSLEVKGAFRRAWNQARLAVAGVPAPDLRKG
jgi:urease accessory protein